MEVPKASPNVDLKMTESATGKEVYNSGSQTPATVPTTAIAMAPAQPVPAVEEEEDMSATVKRGTICRHKGCGVEFESDEANRLGDGEATVCVYHPAPVSTFSFLSFLLYLM